jgi:tetrapyrrole methylase family protein/MazG family protein
LEKSEPKKLTPPLEAIVDLIRRLRAPDGCPWDRKQTCESLSVYLIEEVHELVAAIASGDPAAIGEELGDVLFQVLFLSMLLLETQNFTMDGVVRRNLEKMIRRHPHVFGTQKVASAEEVRDNWQAIKRQEKAHHAPESLLDAIPAGLPALMRAYRISSRAARAGFDWDDLPAVMAKAEEEWREFQSVVVDDPGEAARGEAALEFGDVLFTLANVARFAGFHPETALNQAVSKFERRFRHMEQALTREGLRLEEVAREALETAWVQAKAAVPDHP